MKKTLLALLFAATSFALHADMWRGLTDSNWYSGPKLTEKDLVGYSPQAGIQDPGSLTRGPFSGPRHLLLSRPPGGWGGTPGSFRAASAAHRCVFPPSWPTGRTRKHAASQ